MVGRYSLLRVRKHRGRERAECAERIDLPEKQKQTAQHFQEKKCFLIVFFSITNAGEGILFEISLEM